MRWIPVTERLPEGADAVSCEAWCTGDEGLPAGPCIMAYDPEADPVEPWSSREDTGCWEPGEVTHWRPRPTGPDGGLARAAVDALQRLEGALLDADTPYIPGVREFLEELRTALGVEVPQTPKEQR